MCPLRHQSILGRVKGKPVKIGSGLSYETSIESAVSCEPGISRVESRVDCQFLFEDLIYSLGMIMREMEPR